MAFGGHWQIFGDFPYYGGWCQTLFGQIWVAKRWASRTWRVLCCVVRCVFQKPILNVGTKPLQYLRTPVGYIRDRIPYQIGHHLVDATVLHPWKMVYGMLTCWSNPGIKTSGEYLCPTQHGQTWWTAFLVWCGFRSCTNQMSSKWKAFEALAPA